MIVNIGTVSQAFKRAHSAILDRRGYPMGANHHEVMMRWWQEEYGVGIIPDDKWGRWNQLEFANEADCTAFLLRWA